jgi:hypothetical protein
MLTPVRFKPSAWPSCTPISRDVGFQGWENGCSRSVMAEEVSINLFASAIILLREPYAGLERSLRIGHRLDSFMKLETELLSL